MTRHAYIYTDVVLSHRPGRCSVLVLTRLYEVATAFVECSSANPKMPTEPEIVQKGSERVYTWCVSLCWRCCIMPKIEYKAQRTAFTAVCHLLVCCSQLPSCESKTESSISFLSHLLPPERFIVVVAVAVVAATSAPPCEC